MRNERNVWHHEHFECLRMHRLGASRYNDGEQNNHPYAAHVQVVIQKSTLEMVEAFEFQKLKHKNSLE